MTDRETSRHTYKQTDEWTGRYTRALKYTHAELGEERGGENKIKIISIN